MTTSEPELDLQDLLVDRIHAYLVELGGLPFSRELALELRMIEDELRPDRAGYSYHGIAELARLPDPDDAPPHGYPRPKV